MMALNFQAAKHKKMLMERTKNCTVRLGDVSKLYPEGSVVWITTGKKGEPKHKLYSAYLDKVRVKTMGNVTQLWEITCLWGQVQECLDLSKWGIMQELRQVRLY